MRVINKIRLVSKLNKMYLTFNGNKRNFEINDTYCNLKKKGVVEQMITEQTIYCVGCGLIISREKAERVFRTGFYKLSINLGICCACEEKDKQLMDVSIMEMAHGETNVDSIVYTV